MASAESSEPAVPRELRILVLHNRDFATEPLTGPTDGPEEMDRLARAEILNTAQHIARALVARGHFVEVLGIDTEDVSDFIARLQRDRPDVVFNLCESMSGEDQHEVVVPSLLDLYGVCYTGAGPLGLVLCRDKYRAKHLLRASGVPTPPAVLLPAEPQPPPEDLATIASIGYPLFLKLAGTDGSIGISKRSIVRSDDEFLEQLAFLRTHYNDPILAESYIDGREIYVSLLGNQPARLLPMQEIDFSRLPSSEPRIVSETAKWDVSSPEYEVIHSYAAAPMDPAVQSRIIDVAAKSFVLLGVRDYARCDIRLADDGTPYVIDVNPNCDITEGSGYTRAGLLADIAYDRLVEQIVLVAYQRNRHDYVQRTGVGKQPADSP